jgi:large subunit ribosomal protein L15
MDLSSIPIKIRKKRPKRLGRGPGSGRGKTGGRGHKGAGQRKGKRLPYEGFRGGNLPYLRTIPKRGFHSRLRRTYQIVNLKDIQKKLPQVAEIDPEVLKKSKLIKNEKERVKILAGLNDPFTCKALITADKFSKQAKALIEKAGGKIKCLQR